MLKALMVQDVKMCDYRRANNRRRFRDVLGWCLAMPLTNGGLFLSRQSSDGAVPNWVVSPKVICTRTRHDLIKTLFASSLRQRVALQSAILVVRADACV